MPRTLYCLSGWHMRNETKTKHSLSVLFHTTHMTPITVSDMHLTTEDNADLVCRRLIESGVELTRRPGCDNAWFPVGVGLGQSPRLLVRVAGRR